MYLPPDNYGRDSATLFSHLIALAYAAVDSDITLICGDINAHVGNELDFIPGVDDISSRTVIDSHKNNHGNTLIDFLKDIKMCLINGRITPNFDDFTCISSKGRSVVDYFITFHECLKFGKSLVVSTVNDLICELGIHGLISSKCKAPDHSFVTLELTYSISEGETFYEEPNDIKLQNSAVNKNRIIVLTIGLWNL